MKYKYFDDSLKIVGTIGRISSAPRYAYDEGVVCTKHGIVWVYAQGRDGGNDHHSRLDFVYRGRLYMRSFNNVRFSRLSLARMAVKFAKEIAGRHP